MTAITVAAAIVAVGEKAAIAAATNADEQNNLIEIQKAGTHLYGFRLLRSYCLGLFAVYYCIMAGTGNKVITIHE